MEAFEQLGPLDENLLSACEHTDLCLLARQAGATVYLGTVERRHLRASSAAGIDGPAVFSLALERGLEHGQLGAASPKNGIWPPTIPSLVTIAQFLSKHRRLPLEPLRRAMKVFGRRPARWLEKRRDGADRRSDQSGPISGLSVCADNVARRRKRTASRFSTGRNPMNSYAQTNIQLYGQLLQRNWIDADLRQVQAAYALAMTVFAGHYRPNHKSFLAHLIGTASILAAHGADTTIVAAGLLHSAYSHGEFGDGSRGMTAAKRQTVRRASGDPCEALIARYTTMRWKLPETIALAAGAEQLSDLDRTVALMKLADVLEDHLERGMAYSPNKQLPGGSDADWAWREAFVGVATSLVTIPWQPSFKPRFRRAPSDHCPIFFSATSRHPTSWPRFRIGCEPPSDSARPSAAGARSSRGYRNAPRATPPNREFFELPGARGAVGSLGIF